MNLTGHTDDVRWVAWSPDDSQILTAGDSRVKIWDSNAGRCIQTIEATETYLWSADWSPDGRRIVTSADNDPYPIVWDLRTGEKVYALAGHDKHSRNVDWSPDGRYIASCAEELVIIDLQMEQMYVVLSDQEGFGYSLKWSPDGSMIAASAGDLKIRVWDLETRDLITVIEGMTTVANSLDWSPDGKWIVSGHGDGMAMIWSADTGDLNKVLVGHESGVRTVSWSPQGNRIATGSHDTTIKIWDVSTSNSIRTIEGHSGDVWCVDWSSDGSLLASASEDMTAVIWNPLDGDVIKLLVGHTDDVWDVSWSSDSRWIASAGHDSRLIIWNSKTGTVEGRYRASGGYLFSCEWSPEGTRIAVGSQSGLVSVFNSSTGELTDSFTAHSSAVYDLAWSPDGEALATVSSSKDRTAKILDLSTGEIIQTLPDSTRNIAWSPDGNLIGTTSAYNATAHIWNVGTGELEKDLEGHIDFINAIDWSPDGTTLATSGGDLLVQLWDTTTWDNLGFLSGHTDTINDIDWSPDGNYILTCSEDDTSRIYNVSSRTTVNVLLGHAISVYGGAWSPNSRYIATASRDMTVKVWGNVPNLVIGADDVTFNPSPTTISTMTQVMVNVTNMGLVDAINCVVDLSIVSGHIGYVLLNVPAGETTIATLDWMTPAEPGQYRITAEAYGIPEQEPSDNRIEIIVFIHSFDLEILTEDIDVEDDPIVVNKDVVINITIRNKGYLPADGKDLVLYVANVELHRRSLSLDIGEVVTISYLYDTPSEPGRYGLRASIRDSMDEDWSNNDGYKELIVRACDLVVRSNDIAFNPQPIGMNTNVNLTINVTNKSPVKAENVPIYLRANGTLIHEGLITVAGNDNTLYSYDWVTPNHTGYIEIAVDVSSVIDERPNDNTGNTRLYIMVPDLEINRSSLELSDKPKSGKTITISVSVLNNGYGNLFDVPVRLVKGNKTLEEKNVDVTEGESVRVSFDYEIDKFDLSESKLKIVLGTNETYPDSNMSNNQVTINLSPEMGNDYVMVIGVAIAIVCLVAVILIRKRMSKSEDT